MYRNIKDLLEVNFHLCYTCIERPEMLLFTAIVPQGVSVRKSRVLPVSVNGVNRYQELAEWEHEIKQVFK